MLSLPLARFHVSGTKAEAVMRGNLPETGESRIRARGREGPAVVHDGIHVIRVQPVSWTTLPFLLFSSDDGYFRTSGTS